jgi:hypothetical protein
MESCPFNVLKNYSYVIMSQSETPDVLSISGSSKLWLYRLFKTKHHLEHEAAIALLT